MTEIPTSGNHFRKRIIFSIRTFIKDSRAAGIILICCTLASMLVANSSIGNGYINFWHIALPTGITARLPHTVLHVINDGLMALFFFLAGMEIKRELLSGELSAIKKATLPVVAAAGGMIVPAFIYYLWCSGTPFVRGWGIPMATDIAFSLGILSLLGKRVPLSIKVFLTALAIIDDLGGIITIAIFYAGSINILYLVLATCMFAVLILMNLIKLKSYIIYLIVGIALWYLVFNSGIHATIAGVLLAFTMPMSKIPELEHKLHYLVNFLVLPLFALANTAILLPQEIAPLFLTPLSYGILSGLVLGKPMGIFIFSYITVKLKLGALPEKVRWRQILGMGMIAGIGFTMSIFITTLAFNDEASQLTAKIAIIAGAAISAISGLLFFLLGKSTDQKN